MIKSFYATSVNLSVLSIKTTMLEDFTLMKAFALTWDKGWFITFNSILYFFLL